MKKHEIVVGGTYIAKVAGKLTTVRVDKITESDGRSSRMVPASPDGTGLGAYRAKAIKSVTYYDVTNLATNRKTTFRSAAKFRVVAQPKKDSAQQVVDTLTHGEVVELTSHELAADKSKQIDAVQPDAVMGVEQCSDPTAYASNASAATPSTPTVLTQVSVPTLAYNGGTPSTQQPKITPTTGVPTLTPNPSAIMNDGVTVSNDRTGLAAKIAREMDVPVDDAPHLIVEARAGTPTTTPTSLTNRISQLPPARKLTDEQIAIIETAPTVQVLVIEAGAGCGKTSTDVELARTLKGIGQYTAFNTSLVAESKTKFPRHVNCNTIHSLAFRSEGKKYAHRLNGRRTMSTEVAAMLGLQGMTISGPDGNPKILNAGLLASKVMAAIKRFCQSADAELGLHHFPRMPGLDAEHARTNEDMLKAYLLPFAQKMWADKCDKDGRMPFTHDDYVKMWQLNDPYIAADYILLDEAQDTSPVMLAVMEAQVKRGTRVVLVGDSAQQIYSWRGAVNALASFPDAPRLMLSKSFRFGQVIAEVANAILSHLETKTPLVMKGFEKISSRLVRVDEPTVILCRTNAGAVSRLLDAIASGKKPYLIGGGDDVVAFVRAARDLQGNKTTNHPELSCFSNWREVQTYAKSDDGEDLRLMVKLIDTFGSGKILAALENMPEEKAADLIISTAHKSKGREWSKVQLASDFQPLEKMGDEETRLLYVAATRAQNVLDIESCPPFCGGEKKASDGWNGEGGKLDTIDLTEARRLSDEIGDEPQPVTIPTVVQPHHVTAVEEPGAVVKARTTEHNTWTKGRNGDWLVRGKPGQTGTVEVRRNNGSVSKEKLGKVVWKNEEAALYTVEK